MNRFEVLRKYISKDKLGIEIGPWNQPIAPKRQGYNCLVLDVFDTETLIARAKTDRLTRDGVDNIEAVDLLGSSSEIDEIVERKGLSGQLDYIVSSHNFEHLPNPVKFLQGCEKILKPGGMLSMALPDHRACFDYFRPRTTLATWLEAYFTGRKVPSLSQFFDHQASYSLYHLDQDTSVTFTLKHNPARVLPDRQIRQAFDFWRSHAADSEPIYLDVHCSIFTPASFEQLISDLRFLELIQLELIEISETEAYEFFVHFRRPTTATTPSQPDDFYEKRASLLHRVNSEEGVNSVEAYRMRSELEQAKSKIDQQQREMEEIRKQAEDSGRSIDELHAVIGAIQASKSWHVTAPLRALAARFRRLTPDH